MRTKEITSLYLTNSTVLGLKAKGINVSAEVDKFLDKLLSSIENSKDLSINKMEEDLKKKKLELAFFESTINVKKQNEQLELAFETQKKGDEELGKLKHYYFSVINSRQSPKALIDDIMKKYSLSRELAVKSLEEGKLCLK